ncbi:hypothetical protein OG562_37775 [Streptomyces sp. NBC_01275]|nr:putative leader peptide [Streptomyces sp. NBC_01275]MCX4766628.1 hypothetical protein [Streptomyces sp. NBC_01275]
MSVDETGEAPQRARKGEVPDMTHMFHAVHLHSRAHIDLQRVAAALCCS